MSIHNYPRSAAYLKASNYRLDDPSMSDYAWAVCLSWAWTDEELVEAGTVNYDTMTGEQLLPELERLLGEKAKKAKFPDWMAESLKAFIGSRGVKVSSLKSADDYWAVAAILWPHTVKGKSGDLSYLHHLIKGMSKAERRTASVNLKAVPAKWKPTAEREGATA